MMRLIASAAVCGALVAGASLYAANGSAWMNAIAGRPSASAGTTPVTVAWPICTTMTELGTESDWAQLDPDFAVGKKALVVENWGGAIAALNLAVLRDPLNADIQNYIGYAHARLRQPGPAMGYFQRALMLNPRHRGAREHLGELYLALDEPAKAQEQLAALREVCLIPCDELAGLGRLIAAYEAAAQGTREPGS
jgi:tetratricopeptide (TPR) repeat protein